MDRFQYLIVLGCCVAITLPLEVAGARVWRRPGRLVRAVLPGLLIFSAWDVAAIAHHQWGFSARYTTGWDLPGGLPVEEVLFFALVPVCSLLTYETVRRMSRRR
jgi:lycopene cyclase domain-containing protein